MSKLTDLTITGARAGLDAGEFSARELTEAHIDAMAQHKVLNTFITETPEVALTAADAADKRRAGGQVASPMDGIPIAMKDLFCTADVRTTAGSHILEPFVPPYESTVSAKLKAGGTVMLGKANLDEFAMGSANITSYYGTVTNPWVASGGDNRQRVPGGSSGGSAAAVAARIAIAATGTDTGGSIRQPASYCGIVGMKPTYGRCSRWGVVAYASSLDQPGPMTRSVEDAATMLQVMAGHDPKDSTSAPYATPDFSEKLKTGVKGLRIGLPKEYRVDGMPGEIDRIWEQGADWLRAQGAEVVEISLLHTKYALPAYYIIALAEASSNLARYDGVRFGLRVPGNDLKEMYENTRAEGFGAEVKRRIMIGTYVLSAGYYDAYYIKAQKIRSLILQDFTSAFEKVDAILTPTAPSAAFALGEKQDDPVAMYLNDVFTVPASMAGLPATSVPGGLSDEGLPLGLHLIAKPFDEVTLFQAAQALEDAAGFEARPAGY